MKNLNLSIMLLMLLFSFINAQSQHNLGIGAGLDYGGIGGRFTFHPSEQFGLFVGLGYNLDGAGFNGGALYKFSTEKRVRPYVIAMYGYNGVIVVEDSYTGDDSKTYYGPSFGFGMELKTRRNENNFWNFELLFPVRSSEFSDDIDNLKSEGFSVTEPLPISISIGYHFGL